MNPSRHLVAQLPVAILLSACGAAPTAPDGAVPDAIGLVVQDSRTNASLRGVCAVSQDVCWASGSGNVVLRTVNGGRRWQAMAVPAPEVLDFRDIHALDADTAWVLSAGQPARIYRTDDGGKSWRLLYQCPYEDAFFDAFAFWDARNGLAFSDPVGGRFLVLRTLDGGENWVEVPPLDLPLPQEGEAGFAGSGSCLVVHGTDHGWIGTGGRASRVLRTVDRGRTWTAHETPVRSGADSTGIFSLAFRDPLHGVAVGGDYRNPDADDDVAAITDDGGFTWRSAGNGPGGYRSGVAWSGPTTQTLIAVGSAGADHSVDGGETWQPLDVSQFGGEGLNAVSFAPDGAGWGVGALGRVVRFRLRPR